MPTPLRTRDGKWVIFECSTGKRLERWPVDAREAVAQGDYTYDPPEGHTEPVPPVVPDTPPDPHAAREHSPGVPLVASSVATAAQPVQFPGARTDGGHRSFAGGN